MRATTPGRMLPGFLTLLAILPGPLHAQEADRDSGCAEVRAALRAFYFSLAHHDWQAMSAGILPAKVVAHRQIPEALLAAAGPDPAAGSTFEPMSVTIDGDWATAMVTPDSTIGGGRDRLRFIHFDGR